jgi:hypothetical protein
MSRRVETLLSQIKDVLTDLKHSDGNNSGGAEADIRRVQELSRLALELVQINTNSLTRTTREDIRSMLVASVPYMLAPEEIDIIQKSEAQRATLSQELAGASTRASRREPISSLRWLDEQQMLFLRGVLKDPLKKQLNFKRERKHYFRAMRALGLDTHESPCNNKRR